MSGMALRKIRLKRKLKKALKRKPAAVTVKKVPGIKVRKAAKKLKERKERGKKRVEWDAREIMEEHDYKLEKPRILKSKAYKRWLKKDLHKDIKAYWFGSLKETLNRLIDHYFAYATTETKERYLVTAQAEYLKNLLKDPKKLKGFKELHGY